MSINRVIISGNLTRSPELRTTQGGTAVLTFGVAVNDRRKNPQTGEWEDVPNFVDCVLFGSRAEPLSKFISKGSKVAVEGKLRYSSWESDGQRRSKLEVVADTIEFLSRQDDSKGQRDQQQQHGGNYSGQRQSAPNSRPQGPQGGYYPQQQQPEVDVYDEDIPFSQAAAR